MKYIELKWSTIRQIEKKYAKQGEMRRNENKREKHCMLMPAKSRLNSNLFFPQSVKLYLHFILFNWFQFEICFLFESVASAGRV